MHKILKYPLKIVDSQIIEIQRGARGLCVQAQNCIPTIWAFVDPDAPMVEVQIDIYGTGQEMSADSLKLYIGTVQINGFVWHVFEGIKQNGNK